MTCSYLRRSICSVSRAYKTSCRRASSMIAESVLHPLFVTNSYASWSLKRKQFAQKTLVCLQVEHQLVANLLLQQAQVLVYPKKVRVAILKTVNLIP